MRIESGQVLKHAAFIAKVTGLFPAIIVVITLINKEYESSRILYELAAALIIAYLGYFQMLYKSWIEEKVSHKWLVQKPLILLGYIVTLAAGSYFIVKIMPETVIFKLFFAAFSLVMYFIAIANFPKRYDQILSMEYITVITAIYILALGMSRIGYLGLIYIFIIGIYIFIGNQSSLERLLEQTRANTPMFKNIRNDNMKWVCFFISLILIGYPLRRKLGAAIKWLLMKVLWLFLKLIQLIIDFLNWLLGGSASFDESTQEQPPMQLEGADGNKLADRIFILLIIGVIVFLIVKNREKIKARIKEDIRDLRTLCQRIYRFLFGRKNHVSYKHDGYMETVERIDVDFTQLDKVEARLTKAQWERQAKRYLRKLSASADYREGYKLVLQGAKLRGVPLESSHTPREMLKMIEKRVTLEKLPEGTHIYESVRYGEKKAGSKEIDKIAEILQQLLVLNK